MSGWNYRVIEFVTPDGTPWRAIHEVYYDDAGAPISYAENPAAVVWDSDEGNDSAARTLDMMRRALTLPVLVETDFGK